MNKVNVFRVENPMVSLHSGLVGVGPYCFFSKVAGKEKHEKWGLHCGKYEPGPNIYAKHKIDNLKLKILPTLPNERRPGPFEDMDLRTEMIRRMGAMSKSGKDHFYCFDSISQFKQWFHDFEELKFMEANYFTLSHYVVKASEFIRGHRQAVFFKEGFLYLKTRYNIVTLDQILPNMEPQRTPKLQSKTEKQYVD